MPAIDRWPDILKADLETKRQRLEQALGEAGSRLPADRGREEQLQRILAFSDFASESLIREPQLLERLWNDADLSKPQAPGACDSRLAACLAGTDGVEDLAGRLRRFRRQEMVRIAWRDLTGMADLAATTSDLSDLADACLNQALAWLYAHQCRAQSPPVSADGAPLGVVVLALGKLGARELNFSSDVDLVFAYPSSRLPQAGETGDPEDFFTRLCRRLVQVIGQPTADGFVFRVDLRLRPFGENGPLVLSFDAMERYYQEQGRDWERYAWIKARAVAGAALAGADLLHRLKPFVYRRYLDFGAFESLRAMKHMITQEVARRGMHQNVKLGRGGIREIEFFGQMFQLIRGGVSPELQRRPIRDVLAALAAEGHIPEEVGRELDAAYVFLRTAEHRLQEAADQQTHELPSDPLGRARLAASLGFDSFDAFRAALDRHRDRVHGHFQLLLESPEAERGDPHQDQGLADIWHQKLDAAEASALMAQRGYDPPAEALQVLKDLHEDSATRALSPTGRQRLDRLIPLVVAEAGRAAHPLTALRRLADLLRTVERRTSYLALLLEYPAALAHLVKLVDASPWIASLLSQHPVLLDELLDPRTLYRPPPRSALEAEIKRRLGRAPAEDLEAQIEALCIFKQTNVLRVAAADVSGQLPLMRVSDYLSDIAEVTIDAVVELAWRHLAERHGLPDSHLGGVRCERGFGVIAYGKLGGLELGYGSDLDLVFLHAGADGQTRGGPHPIDNAQFFNRLGQRVIHLLTSHTRAGRVYDIDTRLRASGISGILVQHVDAFHDYQLNHAWTWEHQALIKARPVSGDPLIAARFEAIRAEVLSRPRPRARLRAEVAEMRRRMRAEKHRPAEGLFDLKQDPGGIVDIEFLVQYLVLRLAHRYPELVRWTDNVRLIQTLIGSEVLSEVTAHVLKHAYLIYRAAAHQLSLQERPAQVPAEKFERLQRQIRRIWVVFFPAA
jgi:glutamate-ammonia-ligase adenylyltransferase